MLILPGYLRHKSNEDTERVWLRYEFVYDALNDLKLSLWIHSAGIANELNRFDVVI